MEPVIQDENYWCWRNTFRRSTSVCGKRRICERGWKCPSSLCLFL